MTTPNGNDDDEDFLDIDLDDIGDDEDDLLSDMDASSGDTFFADDLTNDDDVMDLAGGGLDFSDVSDDSSSLDETVDDDLLPSSPKKKKKLSNWAIAGIVIAVVIAILIGLGAFFTNRGDTEGGEQESSTSQPQARQGGDKNATGKVVVRETTGITYEGSDNALNTNGTGAILAFDYAYYQLRSGKDVMAVFDPSNKEYTADNVQAEINKMHPSTRYSLQITPIVIGNQYDVVLTLFIPSGDDIARFTYNQKFTVTQKDGKFYVKEFSSTAAKAR